MIRLPFPFNRIRRDRRGATIIEFAVVLPVTLITIMGLGELTYEIYVQAILQGAMQKAGRDMTLETAQTDYAAIDATVENIVRNVSSRATFDPERKNFHDFSDVHPEPYTDANHNGVHDPNECFSDENGNGQWDAVGGHEDLGGANDVVLYTMTVHYPRLFPVSYFMGGSDQEQTATASTILRSQPYGEQAAEITPPVICPGS